MTHEEYEEYEELNDLMDSIYDIFYDKAEQIKESGNVSEFLKLKDWVNQTHEEMKSWSVGFNAEDAVLKEIGQDFNNLLNELDNMIKEN